MSSALENDLLLEALKLVQNYYERSDIEEMAINRPGEVWLKIIGGGWVAESAPEITYRYIVALCRVLANVTEQNFDKDLMPILSATLPGGHRFQAIIGSNVRYELADTTGISVCIRQFRRDKRFTLEAYKLEAGKTLRTKDEDDKKYKRQRYSDSPYDDLIQAVGKGEAVLISGATSTGKTTFLNAMVEFLPETKRVITVEDTREIILPHVNRVHLVVSRTGATNKVGYSEVLDAVVRMTPDVIICGEVSTTNAKALYRLMTTGHTNFMATIHAETPEMALQAFWQNLAQGDMKVDPETTIDILSKAFGRIVQIDRAKGERVVTGIEIPSMIRDAIKNTAV